LLKCVTCLFRLAHDFDLRRHLVKDEVRTPEALGAVLCRPHLPEAVPPPAHALRPLPSRTFQGAPQSPCTTRSSCSTCPGAIPSICLESRSHSLHLLFLRPCASSSTSGATQWSCSLAASCVVFPAGAVQERLGARSFAVKTRVRNSEGNEPCCLKGTLYLLCPAFSSHVARSSWDSHPPLHDPQKSIQVSRVGDPYN
jgi:hypothetical protein